MTSVSLPSATDFIKKASHTAHHYGFRALEDIKSDTRCKNCEKKNDTKILAPQKRIDALQGMLAAGAGHYLEHNLHGLGEPALFYSIEDVPRTNDIALALHVIGVEKSIAESLLIHTVRSLFRDLEIPDSSQHVRINSLGDRESVTRYSRELNNYLKKRLELLPSTARELMKEHALLSLANLIENEHEIGFKSPSSLEYLNESSRKHFREIIEYLDFSETLYEIDARLLGHHQCYSQTLFSIAAYTHENREEALPIEARGGRYDEFLFQHTKKNIPAVGAVVTLKERKLPARLPRASHIDPQIFIVQLGLGPKLRTLSLLEELKGAHIHAHQSLASDSLSTQLEKARVHGVPYTIILGQKEYVDGTVILRDMRSSSQETVPLGNLVSHLKRALRV
ncbi:ATP phosphoribosyltransferase regulatory subunit [Patescibacteria group bacterium]|jgi:histidyl-tRNA synthetase|nr:ATP phosphoribosyltransferase regulatory subunit [Patescibacteria group bacterium]